jgi:transcriptional regulator with XRE-family HTH domain
MGSAQGNDRKVLITEIGERLRQAREKRGLTIEQTQKHTRIHSTVLSALEDGKCDEILTPNYVKSFLKEYAGYLGLDYQSLVSEYMMIHPELRSKNINLGSAGSEQRRYPGLSDFIRRARSLLIFLIVVALVVFISVKTVAFFKTPKAAKKPQVSKYVNTAKSPVLSHTRLAATRRVPFIMTLKTRNPVMVQLRKDDVVLFKRVLPKGSEETFKVKNLVNIFVGRAEYIEIFINGKSIGIPGKGVIRNLEVTSNGVRIR